jgi:uncharacterized OB-fold protein
MVEGFICKCGEITASKRTTCIKCGNKLDQIKLPDSGKILTYTVLHAVPEGFDPPLSLVMVKLEKGAKLLCSYNGESKLKTGMDVAIGEKNGLYLCKPK